jgi:hypothetical protein
LHICPYKITVVPEIKPVDYEKRAKFCNWFVSYMLDGLFYPKLTFFTDKANFNLLEYVNSQNNGYLSNENPLFLIQLPPYDQKIGVLENLIGRIEFLARVCGPLDPQI